MCNISAAPAARGTRAAAQPRKHPEVSCWHKNGPQTTPPGGEQRENATRLRDNAAQPYHAVFCFFLTLLHPCAPRTRPQRRELLAARDSPALLRHSRPTQKSRLKTAPVVTMAWLQLQQQLQQRHRHFAIIEGKTKPQHKPRTFADW